MLKARIALAALVMAALAAGPSHAQLLTEDSVFLDEIVVGGSLESEAEFGRATVFGDFDGDGHEELAIGVPEGAVGQEAAAGKVYVVAGSAAGLVPANTQVWTRNALAISGFAAAGDHFGAALASGDFDDDGYDDLAIGMPGSAVGPSAGAGQVAVLFGSPSGLGSAGAETLSQDGIAGSTPEADDAFGSSLAVGDFNGDGFHDLAIGSPDETWNAIEAAGIVQIVAGDPSGLEGNPSFFRNQSSLGNIEAGDRFGASLAAGHFASDAADDLAIGVPGEDSSAGVVTLAVGLVGDPDPRVTLVALYETDDCSWAKRNFDFFGRVLAVGHIDDDAYADIVIGAPGSGSQPFQGIACVLLGQPNAVAMTAQSLFQDPNWNDVGEADDFFGFAVAAGDFDGDGRADVAVGTPGENLLATDQGLVTVFPGDALFPLDALVPVHQLTQNSPGVAGTGQAQDQFGYTLAVGDFNGDQIDDLAITILGESGGAGAVIAIQGSRSTIFGDGFENGDFSAWSAVSN